jgi:ABC-2 type transport system ATP-binding protein
MMIAILSKMLRREGDQLWLAFNKQEITASELIRQVSQDVDIHDLMVQEPDIEDVIEKLLPA